ncbi:histone deacetylase [Thermomicrobium sp. 4228-Ro]|uniref:histone deacetylase family protein n=1 Tax=Thermomicrobium sp. 4228-Ro TaxID=2993937 RepID=UPI002248853A|nr:histone deacetylase [Thermomicrobium sp. 4228-Ro]MCX2726747.1 histone deacetylase [Thermomicrobium sp. 4228-Ro]
MTTYSLTALVTSRIFLEHETGDHPERPERLEAIFRYLERTGRLDDRRVIEPDPADEETIALVHDRAYIEELRAFAARGGGWLDADTVVSPRSFEVARLAVGAAVHAVDLVLRGEVPRAFALVRPPGHHAEPDRGMGFCLFNNIAVAAAWALQHHGLERIAIVDWDVHHGNGTQAAFYWTDRVFFVSIHQWPLYPGTGRADEIGEGPGRGYTLNIPLPPRSDDAAYLRAFDEQIEPRLRTYRPELLLVSAGYDAHYADPLAAMAVTEQGFGAMAGRVLAWAHEWCNGRLVLVLEGGYNLSALASSVAATLDVLDGGA